MGSDAGHIALASVVGTYGTPEPEDIASLLSYDSDFSDGVVSKHKTRGNSKRQRLEDDVDDGSEARTRAAQQAKKNREKKKLYVSGLEKKIEELKNENLEVKSRMRIKDNVINQLKEEIMYLRSVLKNQTTLSRLLRKIDIDSDELTENSTDHDYSKAGDLEPSGVCLHVMGAGKMSIELCSRCSKLARQSLQHQTSGN
jgi:hypothetical protein